MCEQSTDRVPIEEIAEKFRRDVLPHISDLLNDDPNNQFEGYVFSYIMAHDGWDWSNARDVEFLSLFAFEALNTNVTEPRDFGHVKYLDEPTRCEDHGFYSWIRGCPYCAELQPCDHCGKLPGVVQDNTGLWDCTHICRGADGICGVINCDTRAEAIVRWNQLQERKKDK